MEQDQEQSIFDKLKYVHIDVNRSLYLIRQLDEKLYAKKIQLNKKQNDQLKKAEQYLQMARDKKFNPNIVLQMNNEMQIIAKLQTQVYGLAKQKVQVAQILVQKLSETHKLSEQQCRKLQIKLNMEPGSVIQLSRKKEQLKNQNLQKKCQMSKQLQDFEQYESIQINQSSLIQNQKKERNKSVGEKKATQKQQKRSQKGSQKKLKIQFKSIPLKKTSQFKNENQDVDTQKLNQKQEKQEKTQKKDQNQQEKQKYCYCGQACYGQMVLCQSNFCLKEWFHRECIQDIELPQKWICKQCRQSNNENMKKKFVRDFVDFQIKNKK